MSSRDLTPKKQKFLTGLIDGKTQRQAALEAGSKSVKAADIYANRMLKDVNFCSAMAEALDKAGCTREKMAAKLNDALDAKDRFGKPDWKINLDAVKLGCQINRDISSTEGNKTTVAIFNADFMDRLIDAYCARQAKPS